MVCVYMCIYGTYVISRRSNWRSYFSPSVSLLVIQEKCVSLQAAWYVFYISVWIGCRILPYCTRDPVTSSPSSVNPSSSLSLLGDSRETSRRLFFNLFIYIFYVLYFFPHLLSSSLWHELYIFSYINSYIIFI